MKIVSLLTMCLLLTGLVYAVGQIDISYAGYTISQPGSYIVVNDLHTTSGQNAITIETSNVTIDLNGHTLYGPGLYGIYSDDNNIAVSNGIVKDFSVDGIHLEGTNNRITQIIAIGNGDDGIEAGDNSLIHGNILHDNDYGTFARGSSCNIQDNNLYQNIYTGIIAWHGSVIINNISNNNQYGIAVLSGCLIKDNTVKNNTEDGIRVSNDCQVVGNTCDNNGSATASGIRVTNSDNMIENNNLTDNDIGLYISVAGNFYAGNRASGNTISDYSTVGAQTAGNGTNGPTNVSYYHQPNRMVHYFAGFDVPIFCDSPDAVIRNLKW